MLGEGITGALYWKDLMRIVTAIGFSPPVLVDVANISIDDPSVQEAIGPPACMHYDYSLPRYR